VPQPSRRIGRPALALALVASLCAACASSAEAPDATPAPPTDVAPPAASLPAASPTPAASVTIAAVGDVSLARQLVERMQAAGPDYPFALVAPLLAADIGFANLEGALTEGGSPWPKAYNFRTPPSLAAGLPRAGFHVVSLANNHTMDYGASGLRDTVAALDAIGVRHAGAGDNLAQAAAPVVERANGLRVAFVACVLTPSEGGGFDIHAWSAAAAAPGVFVCDDARLAAAVGEARRAADFVVVAVHAGDEYRTAPSATQRRLADVALGAGADVYLGAHAHVVQPVEQREGQLIAWGLGNFIFDLDPVDLANIPQPRVSLILKLTLTKGAGVTSFEALPLTLDADQDRPRPATTDEAAALRRLVDGVQ